jgi:hypothetical protein
MSENGHLWVIELKMMLQMLTGYVSSAMIVYLTVKDYKQPDVFGIGENKISSASK